MLRSAFLSLALAALAAAPSAQVGLGEVGFELISNNTSHGTLCGRTFACTYLPADMHRGTTVDLIVRGVHGRPFAVAIGFDQPHQCLRVPGFHNALFSTLVVVPLSGVLTQRDTIRVCPGGIVHAPVAVPRTLPLGSVLVLQALAYSYLNGGEVPTFAPALRAVVR